MTKQSPFKTFILWLPEYRELIISYAMKEDYLDYVEELELPPHYNEEQIYRAAQRHMDDYLRTEGETVILQRALDWADMELLRIIREHWAWELRQRIAGLHALIDSVERENKHSKGKGPKGLKSRSNRKRRIRG